jgi:hypothetical protein
MLACYEVLIAEIFWFGQQTAYDSWLDPRRASGADKLYIVSNYIESSLVVWTRRNANDYTTKTLASTARQQK